MTDDLRMLDELEALETKATPPPWTVSADDFHCAVKIGGEYVPAPYQKPYGRGRCPVNEADGHIIAAARNALPTLLRLARRGLAAGEVVEEIAETCENLQRAAMLNVGDYIHVQGLRGGVEKIKAMADAALARLAAKEAR